jgi:hypothetical protein
MKAANNKKAAPGTENQVPLAKSVHLSILAPDWDEQFLAAKPLTR